MLGLGRQMRIELFELQPCRFVRFRFRQPAMEISASSLPSCSLPGVGAPLAGPSPRSESMSLTKLSDPNLEDVVVKYASKSAWTPSV